MFNRLAILPAALSLLLAACGGGGDSGNVTPGTTMVQIGGTVSGLASGASVVLQNNGANSTTISANGSYSFSTAVASGSSYAVAVQTQPANATCTVANGSGTANAAVTNVTVSCTTNSPNTFSVGGTVSGLASGASVVLLNSGANPTTVSANGSFTFSTTVASGAVYAVTVQTQPAGQTCTVANGSGTISANVTNVTVSCVTVTQSYPVNVTVSGLSGTGLVLRNNGGNNLAITGNGPFSFSTAIANGAGYLVTVFQQPSSPTQTCSVSNGTGTIANGPATVTVSCSTGPTYTIGGSVSGLTGTGLQLHNSNGETLSVPASGSFTFALPMSSGASYLVTVTQSPSTPSQTCTVSNGSGTVGIANVTNVSVSCTTNSYAVRVNVTGLSGSGLTLRNTSVSPVEFLVLSANGISSFTTLIISGGSYAVSIAQQPSLPTQNCTLSNGSGTMGNGPVTLTLSCGAGATTYTVGGTVSGLSGSGLQLRNNGGDTLSVAGNGSFTFATALGSGASYAVTVSQQPSSPAQTCSVSNGSGSVSSANVTNVSVTCVSGPTYTVGGTVSGLSGTGLQLRNNGGDTLTVSGNGTFTFATPLGSGASYSVTVLQQPSSPTQTCTVSNGSGTIASANVTNVTVACTNNTLFTIGGTVSGLSGTGLQLRNNGGDTLTVSGNGSFTFATPLSSGAGYSVTVFQQPSAPTQTCSVSNASGTVASANVSNVTVICSGGGGGSGRYAFYSNEGGTPQVASYSVGANGGLTLVSARPVSANTDVSGPHATGVAVTPSGNHVIVAVDADDNQAIDGELQVYSVSSGQLNYVSRLRMNQHNCSGVGNPGNSGGLSCGIGINSAPETVVIHPNGRFVYVMDGVAHGACTPPGVSPCSPPAGFPAGGNRTIVRYTFDPSSGTLAYQDQHYCEGFVSLAIDPQGRFLWCASYLERRIYEFRINQSDGSLTFGTGTFIGQSNGDMWFGIDPNGRYAYVAHEGDNTIDAYTINSSTGHLTNIGSVNGDCGAAGANCNKATGIAVSNLTVSADGRTLYGAGGGVTAYSLGADGSINPASRTSYNPAVPVNGGGYRALVGIGSAGQFLYLQGYSDSAARVYSINPATGALSETGASPSPLTSGSSSTTAIALQ
jgi:6-phosphogluconolactonase (cycloisomerase 2 family)